MPVTVRRMFLVPWTEISQGRKQTAFFDSFILLLPFWHSITFYICLFCDKYTYPTFLQSTRFHENFESLPARKVLIFPSSHNQLDKYSYSTGHIRAHRKIKLFLQKYHQYSTSSGARLRHFESEAGHLSYHIPTFFFLEKVTAKSGVSRETLSHGSCNSQYTILFHIS